MPPENLHFAIDTVCRATQRQFAQGQKIPFAKEVFDCLPGLLRQINLASLKPRQQFIGRQVDDNDFVSLVKNAIRYGFPDANPGNAADDVVETFQMLDIHRRPHVDAPTKQFFDILPAFGMA